MYETRGARDEKEKRKNFGSKIASTQRRSGKGVEQGWSRGSEWEKEREREVASARERKRKKGGETKKGRTGRERERELETHILLLQLVPGARSHTRTRAPPVVHMLERARGALYAQKEHVDLREEEGQVDFIHSPTPLPSHAVLSAARTQSGDERTNLRCVIRSHWLIFLFFLSFLLLLVPFSPLFAFFCFFYSLFF